MVLSNKMLLVTGAGVAALALVGVGAGASFTDTASAGGMAETGHVQLQMLTGSIAGSEPTYTSDGVQYNWTGATSTKDQTVGSPDNGSDNGFKLPAASPVGSDFTASVPVDILNEGSLPIKKLSLSVAENNTTPNKTEPLASDTQVTIDKATFSGSAVVAGSQIWTGTLSQLTSAGSIDVSSYIGTLDGPNNAHGHQSQWLIVKFAPKNGTYGNADQDGTIAPTFSVTGSDA